ncbi:MAG TPA: hypothetical protein VIM59_12525 [Cellvibrio sp.]
MDLTLIILAEILLILLVVMGFMVSHIRRQKKLIKLMLEKFQQFKAASEEREKEFKEKFANHHPSNSVGANVSLADFFARNLSDSQARYEKHTQAKIPKIEPNEAYSAKVAALRFLYLSAEKEVFEERGLTHAGWNLFERKLADIIRWFNRQTSQRQAVRNNRVRLLQERIDALKPFETENKTLQRRLDQAHRRQKQLEAFQRESRVTINNLQKLIANLQAASADAVGKMESPDGWNNTNAQMDSIAQLSGQKAKALRAIFDEINNHQALMPPAARQKMEQSLKQMEQELIKSDQYIMNLQRELQDAKKRAGQFAGDSASNARTNEMVERQRVMNEIAQLRENNRLQRELIMKLEREINQLRESILTVDDEESRTAKEAEVSRLERLVVDCQNCIETLESQVDNLYSQLREREEEQDQEYHEMGNQGADDDTEFDEEDAEAGNLLAAQELEAMAKEMENIIFQYRQSHGLNQLMEEIFQHADLQGIADAVARFLGEFHAPAGFHLRSTIGTIEYFPEGLFAENARELTRSYTIKEPIFYFDDNTLLSSEHMSLMQASPQEGQRALHETFLQLLVKLVDKYLVQLDAGQQNSGVAQNMYGWAASTKSQLGDLNIQYVYQLEENKRAFNKFMAELRESYNLLSLEGSGAVILDNAINEYEQRMYLIMDSGDLIDREINKLIDNFEQWIH